MYKLTLEIKGTRSELEDMKSFLQASESCLAADDNRDEEELNITIEECSNFNEAKFYRMCDILEKKFWKNVKRLEKEGKVQGRDFV